MTNDGWGKDWNNPPANIEPWPIIDHKPSFSEQLRKQNEEVQAGWGHAKPAVGVDWASGPDITTIHNGKGHGFELKDISISIPMIEEDGQTPCGKLEVEAVEVGSLAVHKAGNLVDWRITHLPTMTKFDMALPEREEGTRFSRNKLVEWCATVQLTLAEEFKILNEYDSTNYKDIPKETKERVLDVCQGISVNT